MKIPLKSIIGMAEITGIVGDSLAVGKAKIVLLSRHSASDSPLRQIW